MSLYGIHDCSNEFMLFLSYNYFMWYRFLFIILQTMQYRKNDSMKTSRQQTVWYNRLYSSHVFTDSITNNILQLTPEMSYPFFQQKFQLYSRNFTVCVDSLIVYEKWLIIDQFKFHNSNLFPFNHRALSSTLNNKYYGFLSNL